MNPLLGAMGGGMPPDPMMGGMPPGMPGNQMPGMPPDAGMLCPHCGAPMPMPDNRAGAPQEMIPQQQLGVDPMAGGGGNSLPPELLMALMGGGGQGMM